ncbi:hypothetical protein PF005_g8830 [Phytophthora fragariae]|uniref:Uncharacterized protein n=1 Tax=Phytophthora fragariae TaxID=53985 RepID=A0A6A3HZ49_9STRA|nr:hypothetical protein PF011_g25346 [Phytophthora fragariae]KAE9118198.1 hypothetical protein PF007_g9017 [Phytophthora fragariae]KAE9147029.1 hypothetical protein PF006_g8244 [Phytophthora fragariae]KAE9216992.1 hypothetical protein PF005_g8830 [Phytophthora fragariae]KAE9314831.1 hypothetical protein PF001_g8078 [Phytophthora fragariae]
MGALWAAGGGETVLAKANSMTGTCSSQNALHSAAPAAWLVRIASGGSCLDAGSGRQGLVFS